MTHTAWRQAGRSEVATIEHSPEPLISVCIVTAHRDEQLRRCLDGLNRQRHAPPFEVLVCANGDPAVKGVVAEVMPTAEVSEIRRRHPGAARNVLVERARGQFLYFLDDDVVPRRTTLARLAELIGEFPDAGVFGGPNETPPGSTSFEQVEGAALASAVGSGPVRFRYGRHPAGPADERFFILCNLAIRRSVMVRFDDDLVCAEENALLEELSRRGVEMRYDPELTVHHDRRPDWRSFAAQMHKYGRGRGQLLRRNPRTRHVVYLLPSLLLVGLVASAGAVVATGPAGAVPLAAYLTALAAGGARIAWSLRRPAAAALGAVLLATIHAAYGTGVVRGLLDRRRRPSRHVRVAQGEVPVRRVHPQRSRALRVDGGDVDADPPVGEAGRPAHPA